jgi:hypothetical protein
LALHTIFGLGYESETPDVSHVDDFLKSVHRQYNQTKADLDNPSITGEERVELRLRHLSQAHALFQLNPTNKELWDTAVGLYAQMTKSNQFTEVYITKGDEHLPLPWYIAFCAKVAIDIPPAIFDVDWTQVWPSEAYFALIELRNTFYTIKSECMIRYSDISCLKVFSFPKL